MGESDLRVHFEPEDEDYYSTLYVNKPLTALTALDVLAIETCLLLYAPKYIVGNSFVQAGHDNSPRAEDCLSWIEWNDRFKGEQDDPS